MNQNTNKNNTHKDSDDKYNINDKYDAVNSLSSTELTGLVRPAPVNEEELESYNEVFTFKTEDIVVNKEAGEKKSKEKDKEYKYK